jgi:hypothetical protein
VVDDWFWGWLEGHVARHGKAGLPPVTSDAGEAEYAAWRANFVHRGIHDEDVATRASEQLVGETLRHSSLHFPRLVEIAIEVYKGRNAGGEAGVDPSSFEAATFASRGCDHCGGTGMAVAYHPEPDAARKVAATVGAHCLCAAGRWIRKAIASKDADLLRRIPDFAEVWQGRTRWSAAPLMTMADVDRFGGEIEPAGKMAILKSIVAAHKLPKGAVVQSPRRPPPVVPFPDDPIIGGEPAYAPY